MHMTSNKINLTASAMARLFDNLAWPALALTRPAKRAVVLVSDACLCLLSVWLAFYLRLGEFVSLSGVILLPLVKQNPAEGLSNNVWGTLM